MDLRICIRGAMAIIKAVRLVDVDTNAGRNACVSSISSDASINTDSITSRSNCTLDATILAVMLIVAVAGLTLRCTGSCNLKLETCNL